MRTLKYLMVPEKDTEVPNIFNMNHELAGDVTSDPQTKPVKNSQTDISVR